MGPVSSATLSSAEAKHILERCTVTVIGRDPDLQAAAQLRTSLVIALRPAGETVVEAAMLWLARDLWSNLDASEARIHLVGRECSNGGTLL